MLDSRSFGDIVRDLVRDSAFRAALTERAAARTLDEDTMRQLIAYARGRQATTGQAVVRRVLTDAGVSWEAV